MSKTMEEIRGMPVDDLKKSVQDAREDMFKKRFAAATESVDHTKLLRESRKEVARMNTVLRERELAATKNQAPKAEAK
jgi:large subunit ribosomal protein L29